jgi:hypothetical protein
LLLLSALGAGGLAPGPLVRDRERIEARGQSADAATVADRARIAGAISNRAGLAKRPSRP